MDEWEATMVHKGELDKIREEYEVFETWRQVSRHVVADLLEACSACGNVREKERLMQCRWCHDVYFCREGTCAQLHHASVHPSVAFWTW
ncbi:MAG: hypothetical protein DMG21_05210 [Acidobacteria bacterium]|nr:MAG: hypothetical protein DMG21_05210 [Acidobacteriota bacterium]